MQHHHREFSYIGPELSHGPLPAFFYFALSAEESLLTPPYNQPVSVLKGFPLRIFSTTLPHHENIGLQNKAHSRWTHSILDPFITSVAETIKDLHSAGHKIGLGGLSRGGLIATHVASKLPFPLPIVGFAPLTKFESLDLIPLIPKLLDKSIRFYIGNCDERVGTDHCFAFIYHLAKAMQAEKIRSPQVELQILPSIGHQGHGTSAETFSNGALWMGTKLGVING